MVNHTIQVDHQRASDMVYLFPFVVSVPVTNCIIKSFEVFFSFVSILYILVAAAGNGSINILLSLRMNNDVIRYCRRLEYGL